MGNEVVNEGKDCGKVANGQDNCCVSLLSLCCDAGKGMANAVRKAEDFGSNVVQGAAAGLGFNINKDTADAITRGAIAVGAGGAAALAAEQAIKHPAAVGAAAAAGAVGGAIAAELLKGGAKEAGKAAGCAAECAKEMAKDAAIGAAIGGAAGALSGDATRAVTLAAMGAITGCAARCAAEMCKPNCCVKPFNPIEAAKEVGKATVDHVTNRPVEAAAEGLIAGVPGVVGGAMLRKVVDTKACENLCDKAIKNTCNELSKQYKWIKGLFE
jgi:hypothetical protein